MPLTHALFVMTAASAVKEISVKSPAFNNMGKIPLKYTTEGANINPPLILGKIPDLTQSIVLIVEDPNAPIDTWVHWLVWGIPPTTKINEATIPGIEGLNSFTGHHYKGPWPSENTRYYFFKVYALDKLLQLSQRSVKYDVIRAMKDHVVGYGELIGIYKCNTTAQMSGHATPDIYI